MDRSEDTLLHLTGGVDASIRLPAPMPRSGTVPVVVLCPDLAPALLPESDPVRVSDASESAALDWLATELASRFRSERHAVVVLQATDGGRLVDATGLVAAMEAAPGEVGKPPLDPARVTVVAIGLAATAAAAAASAWAPSTRLALVSPVAVEQAIRRSERRGDQLAPREPAMRILASLGPLQRLVATPRPTLVVHAAADPDAAGHAAPYVAALRSMNVPVQYGMLAFADADGGDDATRAALVEEIASFIAEGQR